MLLTDTAKTKETATLQKKLIEKRNLFGLGVTSLIAACSADGAGGGNDDNDSREEVDPVTLPFKAEKLTAAQANGYSADKSGGADSLTVKVEKAGTTQATLIFPEATNDDNNRLNSVNIYQLTPNLGQYDLVISSPSIDKNQTTGDPSATNPDYLKGRIFIYWDVAKVASETSPHLEIKGATKEDQIGTFAPDFLQISGAGNNYDMIIRSPLVDTPAANAGAIYILWDIVDYDEATKTIDLNPTELGNANTGATSGSLAIYGTVTLDYIGIHAPDFLQIGGKDSEKKLDMVIRSKSVDHPDGPSDGPSPFRNDDGAIYILWDVVDYKTILNKTIILDSGLDSNADSGLLIIYGRKGNSQEGTGGTQIGTYEPDFLQIGGVAGDNYDMVIRTPASRGTIYILWDVAEYHSADDAKKYKTINLDPAELTSAATGATAGSLRIYGAVANDQIGTHAPEFVQIGGKDDNHDMVIRSHKIDKPGSAGTIHDQGAIYVLWDVEDYYSIPHKEINLAAAAAGATSGLLTIYGAATDANLGSNANNILYGSDGELTNIDKGQDGDNGKNDIAFRDKDYTYVLFGDKIAEVANGKVASKTIDLAKVTVDGLFKYNFNNSTDINSHSAEMATNKADATGYRFVTGSGSDTNIYKNLAEVQTAYTTATSPAMPLSDADADLGVWDIA